MLTDVGYPQFVDPALGFALGWTYYFKYIIVTPNQLTAAALVIQYWCPPEQVNPVSWAIVVLLRRFPDYNPNRESSLLYFG